MLKHEKVTLKPSNECILSHDTVAIVILEDPDNRVYGLFAKPHISIMRKQNPRFLKCNICPHQVLLSV